MSIDNTSFLEDALNAAALAAEAAQAEDFTTAEDTAAVEDASFLGDDLVVEVPRYRNPRPRQAIRLLRRIERVARLLRDVIKLGGHVVLERLVGEVVLERVDDDVQADSDAAKQSEPDCVRVVDIADGHVSIEVALDGHRSENVSLIR